MRTERYILLIFTVLALFAMQGLQAQSMRTLDKGRGDISRLGEDLSIMNDNPFGTTVEYDENGNPIEPKQQADTTKKERIRKPLESYFFSDTLRSQENFLWNIDTYTNNITTGSIDSLQDNFQNDYHFLRTDVGDAYLGNLGGATVPLNYFRRPTDNNFVFTNPYYSYIYTPDNVPHYNVKKPFTQLGYITAGQKRFAEDNLYVIHAQNVSPSTGFNVTYHNSGTKGIYNWQRSRVKDLSVGVSHTGKRYTMHAGYIYNSISQRENGGVTDDYWITDTLMDSSLNVPTRMSDGQNTLKNNVFYLVQSYGVPLARMGEEDFSMAGKPSFYLGHSVQYNRWKRGYQDTYEGTTYQVTDGSDVVLGKANYYENWYINPTATRDTLSESVLSNRVFIQLQPWDRDGLVGVLDAGLGMDNRRFMSFNMQDYLKGYDLVKKNTYYVYGKIGGKFKKYFDWNGHLNYNLSGYQSGDYDMGVGAAVSAYLRQRPITLSGSLRMTGRSPSYWEENYFSNHYVWNNSFSREKETRMEVKLTAPYYNFEAGLYHSLIDGKIYYDEKSMPTQHNEAVNVTGLYLRKDFNLGNFHLGNRAMLQWSTNQKVVPVPLAALYLSYYYQVVAVKNVLTLRFGVDGWYNTRYYAYGYNPAVMQFYNQRERELGEYPMLDAFVSAKWKRVRLVVKFQHVNQEMFGTNDYFNVLHYPLNQRILKYGLSWNFYD
ncbi:MAG: putative porin [Tidjanibacter sp.]|nr:putative porin [Tidjanibacter sp.]